jgi:hypothetical protein
VRRIRFNIASLLIVIFILAVGFAALRESTELWESGLFSLTLVVLLVSILLAILRAEERRAFWLGFAVFGWIYLGLSLVPSIESRLMTTKALTYLDSKLPGSPVVITGQSWGDVQNSQKDQTIAVPSQSYLIRNEHLTAYYKRLLKGGSGTTENFVKIGNSLLTLFMAWFGGQLSRYVYRKNRQGTSGPVPAPVPISNQSGV